MKNSLNVCNCVTSDSLTKAIEIFCTQYNNAGLTEEGAQILCENPNFSNYLLEGFRRFSIMELGYELVCTILGNDFISPEEIMKHQKGIIYTDKQLVNFKETIPSQEILEWCRRNNYMLVAGPNRSMSLSEIRNLYNDYFLIEEASHITRKFSSRDTINPEWIMLRKEPIPGSTSKNWDTQQGMLSKVEVTPNIAEVAWGIITYKVIRNVDLFLSTYVRTSSFDSDRMNIYIGNLDAGLSLYDRYGGRSSFGPGLALSAKLKNLSELSILDFSDSIVPSHLLEVKIEELKLSKRIMTVLENSECKNVGDILNLGLAELRRYRNFAEHSITELKDSLCSIGVILK